MEDAVDVVDGLHGPLSLALFGKAELGLHLAAITHDSRGGDDALWRATHAHQSIDAGVGVEGGDGDGKVTVGNQMDAGAGVSDFVNELLVALAVENADDEFVNGFTECFSHEADV